MWPKNYRDYPRDRTLIHYKVEPGKGIVGCEMHELNSWGEEVHRVLPCRKPGFLATLYSWLFARRKQS